MIKDYLRKSLPIPLQRFYASKYGSFLSQEKYSLFKPPWASYGLLSAAKYASSKGLKSITAIEFGVASGRGLFAMIEAAEQIKRHIGIEIKIFGFDTGEGLPESTDYRDIQGGWKKGDYAPSNIDDLKNRIKGKAELILGDVTDTVEPFRNSINAKSPIGYIDFDLDFYTSTMSAFKIFDTKPEHFLHITPLHFDDVSGKKYHNRFSGVLLAIDEFNSSHKFLKIDIDRSVASKHQYAVDKTWFNKMYNLHVFNHPDRIVPSSRKPKILPSTAH